jgi:hypothetical protein
LEGEEVVRRLRGEPGVDKEVFAWCRWGSPYRRYTRIEGTLPWLGELGLRCRGGHTHRPLGGQETAKALNHPAKWCDFMARRWLELLEVHFWGVVGGAVGAQASSGSQDPDCPRLQPRPPKARVGVTVNAGGEVEEKGVPWGPVGARPLVGPKHWGRWKIAVANRWAVPAHINVLELYAEAIGASWVLRKGNPLVGRRVVLLQDSQVAVFSGTKGRSSSLPLLRPLRRTAALLLAGNLHVDRLWIPSKANPADGPSRGRAIGVFDPG